ncbi:MAG: type II secretion system F family protein [Rubrivivax sp.]|nr:MAG: type II secretion system F family protein [Rubrivivax sp.]
MQVRLSVVRGQEAPCLLSWTAPSIQAARLRAEQAGYQVISAHATMAGLGMPSWLQFNAKLSGGDRAATSELLVWIEQLHALLMAGLSVIEALHTLQRQRTDAWAPIVQSLELHLRHGMSLSSALETSPVFPPLLVALVRSAEVTSDLPQALARYLEHERRSAYVRHQISSVALYPMLLLGVGGSVLMFLMFYVMPRFARIFQGMQGDIPWTARAMVAWAQALKHHGPWVWGVLLGLAALVAIAWFSPQWRGRVMQVLTRQAWLAQRLDTYHLSRWYRTTSMLVRGGIPLPESVQLATQVLPLLMQARAQSVVHAMREGLSPAQAYVQGRMTTAVAEQLVQAGERSGDVGSMLEKAAEFHEVELTRWLERTMRVLEPVVMALIGLGVGGVVIMMYLPIFELASAIQ